MPKDPATSPPATPPDPLDNPRPREEQPREPFYQRYATKITPEIIDDVARVLRSGVPPEAASAYAGISRATYYNWLKRGRRALDQANGDAPAIIESNLYAAFVVAVDHALSQFITGAMAVIGTAARAKADGDWRAAAWQLEARFPAHFGRRTRHEIVGKDGGPIQIDHAIVLDPTALDRLPLERKLLLAEILAEVDGEIIDQSPLLELEA